MITENMEIMMEIDPSQMDGSRTMRMTCQKCREPSKYEMNSYKVRHECLTDQISFPWTLEGYQKYLDDHRISPKSEPAPEPDLTVQGKKVAKQALELVRARMKK